MAKLIQFYCRRKDEKSKKEKTIGQCLINTDLHCQTKTNISK